MSTESTGITTEEFEYLHHGDRALGMRLYRPDGPGPFPVVLDIHGGAWCTGDLNDCAKRDEALARTGFAAAAIDFRQAEDGYPTSLADINYAIRWLKARAGDLRLDAGRVAAFGQSSGGHLAMLAAMRPDDASYAAIPLPDGLAAQDARVRCVAMNWPVINPLSRYRHALGARASAGSHDWVGDLPERHDRYWKTEAAMAEGNPVIALESGEAVETPPAVWIQPRDDIVHDYLDPESGGDLNEPERFAVAYRKAGGDIDVVYIGADERGTPANLSALVEFLGRHL